MAAEPAPAPRAATLVFSAGWRLFFLLAGLYGVVAGLAWVAWLGLHAAGGAVLRPTIAVAPYLWHGHEMVFGYATAALAGFSLTAVPEWTRTPPLRGRPLMVLGGAWLAGRVVMWSSAVLPAWFVAAVDLAFLPLLALAVAAALRHKPAPRNAVLLAIFAVLIAANTLVHLHWLEVTEGGATTGLAVGLLGFAALIAMIGGRVVPAFTRNALMRDGAADGLPVSRVPLEAVAVGALWLLLLARAVELPAPALAALAGTAALAHALRMALWRGDRTLHAPIVWSLHLGYAWLVVGLAALAFGYGTGLLPESAALHAIAIGGVGGMTLAVMSRAALGHSGRPLRVAAPIAWAYALVAVSAALRVFAPALAPGHFTLWILLAAAAWLLAFALFLAVYWPIFTGPALGVAD